MMSRKDGVIFGNSCKIALSFFIGLALGGFSVGLFAKGKHSDREGLDDLAYFYLKVAVCDRLRRDEAKPLLEELERQIKRDVVSIIEKYGWHPESGEILFNTKKYFRAYNIAVPEGARDAFEALPEHRPIEKSIGELISTQDDER